MSILVYLDYAATTPIRDDVLKTFNEASKKFYGNSSSLHDVGTEANRALSLCREQLANVIEGKKEGIYFTSGGSESNFLAIRSILLGNQSKGKHIITTKVEHASLFHLFEQLQEEGYEVTFIGVDEYGRIKVEELEKAICEETILASIQHANSETGVIQPLVEIGEILARHDVIFHADAVQTFGKIPIDVRRCKIDSLSVSSHKIYGPKGIGACYVDPAVKWMSQFPGATHEGGFRMGTVDVPSVIAFTKAVQLAIQQMPVEAERLSKLRHQFIEKIRPLQKYLTIEAHPSKQLPHIVGLLFRHLQGQHVMLECNRHNIAISTGSACQVGEQNPSRMMLATGKTVEEANGFVRISFGLKTTSDHIQKVCQVLENVLGSVQAQ